MTLLPGIFLLSASRKRFAICQPDGACNNKRIASSTLVIVELLSYDSHFAKVVFTNVGLQTLGAIHKVRHARGGEGPRRCDSV